ncbi:hypothetical protein NE237_032135 [Protea cynaroides]|uniref:Uncharacterized protein n=1 Tax=Protea cynaroides TaxID=273540 RepID=A0A9Q0R2T6_9MAGN|nr:hypothetical protein NE237_032135 [Protea cynaroides]
MHAIFLTVAFSIVGAREVNTVESTKRVRVFFCNLEMLWSIEECLGRIIDIIDEDKSDRIIEEDELAKDESDFDEELKDFLPKIKGENRDGIEAVTTIFTSNDEVIETMTTDTIVKVGFYGVLSIESLSSFETTVDVEEGMEIDCGYNSSACVVLIEDIDRNIMAQSINVTVKMLFMFGWYKWDTFSTDITAEGVKEWLKSLPRGENPPSLLIMEMVHAACALEMIVILGDGGSLLNLGGWKIRAVGTVSGAEFGASASSEVDFAFISSVSQVRDLKKTLEFEQPQNVTCHSPLHSGPAIASPVNIPAKYGASLEKDGSEFGDQMIFTGLRSGGIELSKSFGTYEVEYGEVEQTSGLKKKSELLTCSDKSFWTKTDLQLGAEAISSWIPKPTETIMGRNYSN